MSLIGRNLLSLYLMHLPLVYVSFAYWPNIDPWLMILINVCCLSMVVMLFAEMLRRLHLGVLIGEKGYSL
ncbi:hypothetical protein EHS19_04245 [Bifidobacterium jacchi]|uniref:Uncharacterized protein n=1 Tax=Bifidobacterium jacchi TaxID=2490545 RepID=A0A5N5RKQ8_9BIFI|nr:hypothetical protein EHS19_04245 [Bifidobacterium jacchi]